MPKGMVQNHSIAGSFSRHHCAGPMYASILPWEAASKHSNGCMIWPPGKTSIRNRPALISSTVFASRCAAPCGWSSAAGKAVDNRHWIFRCARTDGASTIVGAATAVAAAFALARNLRRPVMLSPDELMVGAFGDVVPRADERLELRE